MYQYTAYGLFIHSELSLPELDILSPSDISLEDPVSITLGHVPDEIPGVVEQGLYYQSKPDQLRLHVPNIAKFLVQNSTQIIIEPIGKLDVQGIRAFILTSCLAALLIQRNFFVMRGIVIKVQDYSIALIGKMDSAYLPISSLLIKQGYKILSDEICIINQNIETLPSFPYRYLWLSSTWKEALYGKQCSRLRQSIQKCIVPLKKSFYPHALPLKKIFVLSLPNKPGTAEISSLSGSKKVIALQKHIYNNHYVSGLGKNSIYFNYLNKIASNIDFISINTEMHHKKFIKNTIAVIEKQIIGGTYA